LLTNEGWEFYLTDSIARELKEPSCDILEQLGVKRYSLSEREVAEIQALRKQKRALSVADASSVVAARALGALILTGERSLREKAQELALLRRGVPHPAGRPSRGMHKFNQIGA
jgi:predicted nucleic acid-binding protein